MIISAKCFLNAFKHSQLYVFGLASVIGAVAAFRAFPFAEHSWLSAAQLIIDETKSQKTANVIHEPSHYALRFRRSNVFLLWLCFIRTLTN